MLLSIVGHISLELLKMNYQITFIQVRQDRDTQRNTSTDIWAEHGDTQREQTANFNSKTKLREKHCSGAPLSPFSRNVVNFTNFRKREVEHHFHFETYSNISLHAKYIQQIKSATLAAANQGRRLSCPSQSIFVELSCCQRSF